MVTKAEYIKKHGQARWDQICKTGWLDTITLELLPDGEADIPLKDIRNAELAADGKPVLDWD